MHAIWRPLPHKHDIWQHVHRPQPVFMHLLANIQYNLFFSATLEAWVSKHTSIPHGIVRACMQSWGERILLTHHAYAFVTVLMMRTKEFDVAHCNGTPC